MFLKGRVYLEVKSYQQAFDLTIAALENELEYKAPQEVILDALSLLFKLAHHHRDALSVESFSQFEKFKEADWFKEAEEALLKQQNEEDNEN